MEGIFANEAYNRELIAKIVKKIKKQAVNR